VPTVRPPAASRASGRVEARLTVGVGVPGPGLQRRRASLAGRGLEDLRKPGAEPGPALIVGDPSPHPRHRLAVLESVDPEANQAVAEDCAEEAIGRVRAGHLGEHLLRRLVQVSRADLLAVQGVVQLGLCHQVVPAGAAFASRDRQFSDLGIGHLPSIPEQAC